MRSVQTTLETLADANRTEDIPDGADAPDAPDTAGESDEADAPDAGDAQDAADASDTSDGLSASTEPEIQAASAPVTAVTPGETPDAGQPAEENDPDENGSDGVYIVEEGDTLAIISKKMYGDVNHVDAICRMNGISDGNLIYIGQKLLLP